MRLRKEASLGISTMLALQILLSVLAITLLERMGPEIERIIDENVFSIEAVEDMLAQLAAHHGEQLEEVPEAFRKALARAQANVTEEAEKPLLKLISESQEDAFRGDVARRQQMVVALRSLGQVNRESMIRADEKAKRLSQTGAWGAALLGAVALFLAIVVYRQLRLRIEMPIEHLHRTTERMRAGNLQARCMVTTGPLEVQRISKDINWLLDRIALAETKNLHAEERDPEYELEVRKALVWLLDQQDGPAMIVNADGKKVACNQQALALDEATLEKLDDASFHECAIKHTPFRFIQIDVPSKPDAQS